MTITRGDSGAYTFTRRDDNGNPILTSPETLFFTVKQSYDCESALFQKTISDMTLDSEGAWHFTIDPADTENLPYGMYVYDIEVTDDDGAYVATIAKGTLSVTKESTWAVNRDV